VAFDPVALQLWLDPLARSSAPVQELCEFHVDRLTVPRGWSATDRRPGGGAIAVPAVAVAAAVPEPVVVEREPEPEPVVVEREPEPEPVAVEREPDSEPVVVEREPASSPAASVRPRESRERKPPRRPPGRPPSRRPAKGAEPSLLSRAFAWTGPQESILTQDGPEQSEALDSRKD